MSTLVLAEPGSTHEGSRDAMLKLLDVAAAAGCDGMKWQWLSSAERLCGRRQAKDYLDSYRLIEGDEALLRFMARETRARGLRMAATAYLPEDIPIVAQHVDTVKLASFDAGALLDDALECGRPLIVSAGMTDHAEMETRAEMLATADARHGLLVCTSAYPCPVDEAHLAVLRGSWPGVRIGLSDHTRYPYTGALAVAAGARIVEFHIRSYECPPANRDYAVARDPQEANAYVAHLRLAEKALGDGVQRMQPSEVAMGAYRVRG